MRYNCYTACILTLVIFISVPDSIYGQNQEINSGAEGVNQTKFSDIGPLMSINSVDKLLQVDITASLAGLALAAAAFLFGYKPEAKAAKANAGDSKEFDKALENEKKINQAKKNFIYSFFALIICTLVILGFDIAQVGITNPDEKFDSELTNAISKYGIFSASLFFLGRGALKLYQVANLPLF